jgi:ribosomal protein S18 acetylase RimI-like enzyme
VLPANTVRTTCDKISEHPLGLATRYVVNQDGEPIASGELFADSPIISGTGQLLAIRWEADQVDAAYAIASAAIGDARSGGEIHLQANVEVHDHIAERLALADAFGFQLWQEKEGFWWADEGQELPAPERIHCRSLAEIGPAAYAEVVADTAVDSLDRVQTAGVRLTDPLSWATDFITTYAHDEDADTWLIAEDDGGEPVGFVAVAAFDEEHTGAIYHIGVRVGHRGRGYVDELMRAANRAARGRGWTGMLNEVDVNNAPMLAAMERNGHHADARPWHKWYYRLSV